MAAKLQNERSRRKRSDSASAADVMDAQAALALAHLLANGFESGTIGGLRRLRRLKQRVEGRGKRAKRGAFERFLNSDSLGASAWAGDLELLRQIDGRARGGLETIKGVAAKEALELVYQRPFTVEEALRKLEACRKLIDKKRKAGELPIGDARSDDPDFSMVEVLKNLER